MKLSASIQAHPDREELVKALTSSLDREVPVAWDPEGPPSGNSDRGWRSAKRAWEMHDPGADYHLVLQDDAIASPDLLAGLEQALERLPENAIASAYLGAGGAWGARWSGLVAEANERRASWVVSSKLGWGVAIILPVPLIPEMIERSDRWNGTGVTDDMRVAGWAEKRHTPVWYCWPSLVDHRAVPSLTKHRAKDRKAWRHHQGSVLDLAWDGPVVQDPALRRLRPLRSGPSANRQVTSGLAAPGTGKVGKRA